MGRGDLAKVRSRHERERKKKARQKRKAAEHFEARKAARRKR